MKLSNPSQFDTLCWLFTLLQDLHITEAEVAYDDLLEEYGPDYDYCDYCDNRKVDCSCDSGHGYGEDGYGAEYNDESSFE